MNQNNQLNSYLLRIMSFALLHKSQLDCLPAMTTWDLRPSAKHFDKTSLTICSFIWSRYLPTTQYDASWLLLMVPSPDMFWYRTIVETLLVAIVCDILSIAGLTFREPPQTYLFACFFCFSFVLDTKWWFLNLVFR